MRAVYGYASVLIRYRIHKKRAEAKFNKVRYFTRRVGTC
jgi:hypothetical protein